MDFPNVKIILILAILNIFLLLVSYGLQESFGGGAFVAGDTNVIILDGPDIEDWSWINILDNFYELVVYVGTAFGILFSLFTFDIVGLPVLVRLMIVGPWVIVNLYIALAIILSMIESIGNIIPLT